MCRLPMTARAAAFESAIFHDLTYQVGGIILVQLVAAHAVNVHFAGDWRMATGWAAEGAVQDQIDATVKDGVDRAKSRLPNGPGLTHCEECENEIPAARRAAIPGVRLCLPCQDAHDREVERFSGYNRRGSKDSQLR
jgi:phage/conjugal plasmid C-4 type zinc finger TraR family protein